MENVPFALFIGEEIKLCDSRHEERFGSNHQRTEVTEDPESGERQPAL